MNLRRILLRFFLPMVGSFFILSLVSMLPAVQKVYYESFQDFALSAVENSDPAIHYKVKKGMEDEGAPSAVTLLFNSKQYLQALINRAKVTGQHNYDYFGITVNINEHFITPLIFFFSLLLVSPGNWKRKLLNFFLGSLLIIGFAYLTVRFKAFYSVAEAGMPGLIYDAREIKAYKVMSFFFSSVTTITVVLLVWILSAFRKSEMKQLFSV